MHVTDLDTAQRTMPSSAPRKVLLVEDNEGDARIAKELIRETSASRYVLVHVSRLSAALRQLSVDSFDAALVDLSLLDTRGLTTLEQLKSVFPSLPIVIWLSADSCG